LVDRVRGNLAANDLPAEVLTLRVTASTLIADLAQAAAVLGELADAGVSVSMGDYGTGYSSLSYLHHLPIQVLQADRSFVSMLSANQVKQSIVAGLAELGHGLGVRLAAAGVQDEGSCGLLASAGFDLVQGSHLSEPLEPTELERWLRSGPELRVPAAHA
jgi:EAL domain-containing protein (putative c-di-GMP-specific phosphodiesterase class I)